MESKPPVDKIERYLKPALAQFRHLRDDYSDEVPDVTRRLAPGDKLYGKSKYHGHWFVGIQGEIWSLLDHNVLEDPEQIAKANEFLKFLEELDARAFTEEGRVTKEDIQKANETLDYFLNRYPI